jgi:hypothetical protein
MILNNLGETAGATAKPAVEFQSEPAAPKQGAEKKTPQ